ncbi:unnamed protein product [Boreogadus saida]
MSTVPFTWGFQCLTWNYSERGHGKGAPDGVGACVKRMADQAVQRGAALQTAEALFDFLSSKEMKIQIKWIEEKDIEKFDKLLPPVLPAVKGILDEDIESDQDVLEVGKFIIVKYDEKQYVGQVLNIQGEEIQCGKLLELKSRQTARMKGFRARAKEWAEKTKKSRNQAKVFDHTALMMEKMKALGYFPLLMWGKYKPRTNKWSAQLQCPYELPPMAHAVLERIICLFEGMLEACQPDNDQMGQQERTEDDQREQREGGEVVGTEERRDEEEIETEVERGTLTDTRDETEGEQEEPEVMEKGEMETEGEIETMTDTRDEKEGEQEESEVTEKGEMEKTDDVEIENKRDAEKLMFEKKSRAANG